MPSLPPSTQRIIARFFRLLPLSYNTSKPCPPATAHPRHCTSERIAASPARDGPPRSPGRFTTWWRKPGWSRPRTEAKTSKDWAKDAQRLAGRRRSADCLRLFGLKRGHLYAVEKYGFIKACSLRRPGQDQHLAKGLQVEGLDDLHFIKGAAVPFDILA